MCAAGLTANQAFNAVAGGIDGIAPLYDYGEGLKQPPLGARVNAPSDQLAGYHAANRTLALAISCVNQALREIPDYSRMRIGLVFATTVAGITRSERFFADLLKDEAAIANASRELAFHEPAAIAGELATRCNFDGFHTLSTACSTGLHAIGMAMRLIDKGYFDLCVAAGADALSVLTIRGFSSLLLIDPVGCRPFDAARAGTSLGEGAGALVLASEKAARELGMKPLALAAGWGASADAHHMTAPHPEGAGAVAAMRSALLEARTTPEQIDMIATHGTGTPDNDAAEARAIKAVFSAVPPFCSMKRTIGHTLAASGILEAIFAIQALTQGIIPATGGFATPDPNLGLQPAPRTKKSLQCVLKNSFGFGGNNASMVFATA